MVLNRKIIKSFVFIAFFVGSIAQLKAQDFPAWYLVSFTDKNNTSYQLDNPQEFLSEAAILRRDKNDISIDSTDLPVNQNYLDSLLSKNIYIMHTSKWMNAALVKLDTITQLAEISNISIVDSIAYMAGFIAPLVSKASQASNSKMSARSSDYYEDFSEYKVTSNRIEMVNLDPLLSSNSGSGVNIAVFDNGFLKVNTMEAFSHLYEKGNVKYTQNFTNDNKDVYNSGSHGTSVLSTMAAVIEDEFMGSAVGANYYLFQTEDNRCELPIEEANWLFAAEKADSLGVDIITSSLVYTSYDDPTLSHNHNQLDGETAIISRAANMAFTKGIIVFNSAGNDGNGSWGKIGFPCDADGIITVGAVDKDEVIADFSSRGYSADGRVKPDICAEGQQTPVLYTNGEIAYGDGTSFSTPFAAGAMATLMQALPNAKCADLRDALILSSDQYSNPNSSKGYGIPDFYLASILLKQDIMIDQIQEDKFTVLPNPFFDKFFVMYYCNDSATININIYNMTGKKLREIINYNCHSGNNLITVDGISDLKLGIYIVELVSGEDRFTKKVVKE